MQFAVTEDTVNRVAMGGEHTEELPVATLDRVLLL